MINHQAIISTLNKLIEDTKNDSISWHTSADESDLPQIQPVEDAMPQISNVFGETIYCNRSYYYADTDATFFLVAKTNRISALMSTSFSLYLYIKLKEAPYSRLIAKTTDEESKESKEVSVAMRRLHNIIESIDPDYDDKINYFLNDFLKE